MDHANPHDNNTERRTCNNGNVINAVQAGNEINMIPCKNNKASKTLFLLIFIFLLLHSPRLAGSVGDTILGLQKNNISDVLEIPHWLSIVLGLSDLCMVINASINFLVYMYLNTSKVINTFSFCKPLFLRS